MPQPNRRAFLKRAGLAAGAAAAPRWLAAAEPPDTPPRARKPNIIYILLDELGYYELSCMGHPDMVTPNIDRLAAEGVRFTQFLAGSSVCAPTRCSLMTGKHTGHCSVRTNNGWEPMRAGEETVASMLKRAGYATGGFGKWGCGARATSGVPETHGFDLFFGYYDQVHAHTYFPRYLVRNSAEVPLEGNTGNPREGRTFSHTRIVEEAWRFLREHRGGPFFLCLPWTPPHGQWGFPREDPSWALYRDRAWDVAQPTLDDARIYAAMVNMVDRQVGDLRALLRNFGLERDTLILLSGDNGGFTYFSGADPRRRDTPPLRPDGLFRPNVDPRTGRRFRGHKGLLYEGGLRVPCIAHWPGTIPAGRVSGHLGYFPDLMPTLADLAGVACPRDTDGISILPEILGADAAARRQAAHDHLYWELGGQVAVRQGDWKAVRPGANRPWELYDLAADLSETADLAGGQPDVLARLTRLAAEAHTPMQPGEVFDPGLVNRDRYIPLGRAIPDRPWGPPPAKGRRGKA